MIHSIRSFDLKKRIKVEDYYQITLFSSKNFTDLIRNPKMPLFQEFPIKIYSFGINNQQLYDNTSETALANMFTLQESLPVFYISDFREIKLFIDFLIPQLSVRYRPKCLIMYSPNDFVFNKVEIDIKNSLKYAWKKRFLDFSVLVIFTENTIASLIYYYSPFDDVIYQKNLQNKNIKIFLDKVRNFYGFPFYAKGLKLSAQNVQIKQPNGKVKIIESEYFFINFITQILNLNLVTDDEFYDFVFAQKNL